MVEKKAAIGTWAREWRENYENARSVRRVSVMLMTLDHAVRAVRGHLDRAVPGQADQHSHHRAAGSRQRGAQGQPEAPRRGARGRRAGLAGARLQPDDPGAGSQQPRARPPPPLHRSHPRKHSHRRDFDRLGRLHPARQPRALPRSFPADAGGTGPPAWKTCSRARTRPKSSTS